MVVSDDDIGDVMIYVEMCRNTAIRHEMMARDVKW